MMTMEHTSKSELAKILAPLTILPGADRMTEGHWSAYHAVLKGYFPVELKAVSKHLFSTSTFWPQPKAILGILHSQRRKLGPNWLERVQALQLGAPDPGPMTLLTEQERADIISAIPGAKRIGYAKSGEG